MKRPEESNWHRSASHNPIVGARYDEGRLMRQRLFSESCRDIALRILLLVIFFIILFAILEHDRLRHSCEGGRWRGLGSETVCE